MVSILRWTANASTKLSIGTQNVRHTCVKNLSRQGLLEKEACFRLSRRDFVKYAGSCQAHNGQRENNRALAIRGKPIRIQFLTLFCWTIGCVSVWKTRYLRAIYPDMCSMCLLIFSSRKLDIPYDSARARWGGGCVSTIFAIHREPTLGSALHRNLRGKYQPSTEALRGHEKVFFKELCSNLFPRYWEP